MRGAAERCTDGSEKAVFDKVQRILDEKIRKYEGRLNTIRFTTNSSGEISCYPCNCETYDCIGQFNLTHEELEALQFLAPDLKYVSTIDLIEEVIEEEGVVEIVYYEVGEGLTGSGLRTKTGSLGIFIVNKGEFDDLKAAYKGRISFRKPEEDGPNRSAYVSAIESVLEPESRPTPKPKKSPIKTPFANVLSQVEAHELTLIGFTAVEVKRMQLVLRGVARVLMVNHELSENEALEILRLNIGDAASTVLKLGEK